MLEKNVDSYVTVEESNNLVEKLFQYDGIGAYWQALECEAKASFLLQSMNELEVLPVSGTVVTFLQQLQFPRYSNSHRFIGIPTVPKEVKEAQVVNAVEIFRLTLGLEAKYKKGNILTSGRAETIMRSWTCGGFKFGGDF